MFRVGGIKQNDIALLIRKGNFAIAHPGGNGTQRLIGGKPGDLAAGGNLPDNGGVAGVIADGERQAGLVGDGVGGDPADGFAVEVEQTGRSEGVVGTDDEAVGVSVDEVGGGGGAGGEGVFLDTFKGIVVLAVVVELALMAAGGGGVGHVSTTPFPSPLSRPLLPLTAFPLSLSISSPLSASLLTSFSLLKFSSPMVPKCLPRSHASISANALPVYSMPLWGDILRFSCMQSRSSMMSCSRRLCTAALGRYLVFLACAMVLGRPVGSGRPSHADEVDEDSMKDVAGSEGEKGRERGREGEVEKKK